jgi:hypothetical protein
VLLKKEKQFNVHLWNSARLAFCAWQPSWKTGPRAAACSNGPLRAGLRAPPYARRVGAKTTWAWANILPSRIGRKKPDRARLDLDRRTVMDGRARVSAEKQTQRRPPLGNPSSFVPSTAPPSSPHEPASESGGDRWCVAPR